MFLFFVCEHFFCVENKLSYIAPKDRYIEEMVYCFLEI